MKYSKALFRLLTAIFPWQLRMILFWQLDLRFRAVFSWCCGSVIFVWSYSCILLGGVDTARSSSPLETMLQVWPDGVIRESFEENLSLHDSVRTTNSFYDAVGVFSGPFEILLILSLMQLICRVLTHSMEHWRSILFDTLFSNLLKYFRKYRHNSQSNGITQWVVIIWPCRVRIL